MPATNKDSSMFVDCFDPCNYYVESKKTKKRRVVFAKRIAYKSNFTAGDVQVEADQPGTSAACAIFITNA